MLTPLGGKWLEGRVTKNLKATRQPHPPLATHRDNFRRQCLWHCRMTIASLWHRRGPSHMLVGVCGPVTSRESGLCARGVRMHAGTRRSAEKLHRPADGALPLPATLAATHRNRERDRASSGALALALALETFWLAGAFSPRPQTILLRPPTTSSTTWPARFSSTAGGTPASDLCKWSK